MASNTPSLNKLVEIIGLVSRNHRMVKDFRFGPLWDMNALKDLQTPYIWCEEAQSRIAIANSGGGPGVHKTGLYTFRLYCMDRIQKDQSNYNEILSDTKFILDTIMTEIDQHPLFIQLGLSIDAGDIVFEPVYEETDVNANGHSVEFTLRFPIRYSPCNVPIDPLAGYTYSLNNNVFNYSVVGVPGPTGPQGITGPTGVQGPTGPQGVRGFQGAGGTSSFYGIFYDTSIQTNDTTYNKFKFNSQQAASGVTINNLTEITIAAKGTYNIQFSAQLDKTDSGTDDIEIWLTRNGNVESWSNTRLTLSGNNTKLVAAWNWMVDVNANDYFEIIWNSADPNIRLYAESSPPAQVAIPSIILTVQLLTFQGPQGFRGFQGFQGFQGNTGPQGFQGNTGPQGFQGETGSQGNIGVQGATGPQGDFGPQGDIGPQGNTGATGSDGPQGATGNQGTTGPQGNDGPQGFSYPVSITNINGIWYNSGDLIDPGFTTITQTYTDGDGIYVNKGQLILAEDISAPIGNRVIITADTLTDERTWTFPDTTDTFVGKTSQQTLSGKIFDSVAFYPSGITSSKGDLFYTPTNGGYITRLGIGQTGSILGATNGIPTWISPGATNSVLTIVNGLPRFVTKNIVKTTDSNAVTGVIVNTLLDSILIPANTISPGDIIEFKTRVRKTGTAGTMIERFYVGTQSSITGTNVIGLSSTAGATTLTMTMQRTMVVKSSTQSETFGITNTLLTDDGQASTIAVTTTNIDWTRDNYFIIGMQPSNAGDSIRSSFIQIRIND